MKYDFVHHGKSVSIAGPGVAVVLHVPGLPKRKCDKVITALQAAYEAGADSIERDSIPPCSCESGYDDGTRTCATSSPRS